MYAIQWPVSSKISALKLAGIMETHPVDMKNLEEARKAVQ